MSTTTYYSFGKAKLGHPVRDDDIGDNLDLIDTAIHDREAEYDAHDIAKTGIHGVGSDYIAKVSNSDQKLRIVDFPAAEFDAASKIPLLDASTFLKLAQIIGNVPSLDANGKLILTGPGQIGTKTADLANLWTKATKIAKADLTSAEFNAANGICGLDASADVPLAQIPDTLTGKDADSVDSKEPGTTAGKLVYLDASAYLALSQIVGNVPALDAVGKLILTGTSQIGTKATDLAALWDKTTKIVKADIDSGEFDVASKIPALDASTYLLLSQVVGNVPSLDATGKLILTGSGQIGTKATNLAELWDKTTKIVKADIDSGEFDVASKIPSLDASVFLALSQVVGNVPSLDGNGKLVLTGSGQIGTKTADLAELWTKGTLIDASMIGLNELHADGSSNFAGPGGVTITHNLNLANYTPTITPSADGAGAIGEIWITDIAVNSFVVRNSGAGVTAFTWIAHNRT